MNEQQKLRRTIHGYDFAIYEMVLYLDTHPLDKMALQKLQYFKTKRALAVEEYELKFGPYIVKANQVNNEHHWSWVDDPWPWENEAN